MEVFLGILVWIIFFVSNILLAEINIQIRDHRIQTGNKKQIEHFYWGLGYAVLCGFPFAMILLIWKIQLPYYLAGYGSLIFLHASVFPVFYNKYGELPAWNLSKTSKSVLEKLYVRIGLKSIEVPVLISFAISIFLLAIQINHL